MRCGGGKNKAALPFELHPGQREFLEAQVLIHPTAPGIACSKSAILL
eukprot:COSAG04_NODE_14670_length_559_cov_6.600304_2_plen_46_part_01